jgi:hypothetical protein
VPFALEQRKEKTGFVSSSRALTTAWKRIVLDPRLDDLGVSIDLRVGLGQGVL